MSGAEHPLGVSLCGRLAEFGALVIAVGHDDQALQDLARKQPERIEHLVLRPGRRDVLGLLRDAWGGQPVDLFADLIGLMPQRETPGDQPARRGFAQSAGVAAALAEGIRAGKAFCTLAIPQADGEPTPDQQARSAGCTALARSFSKDVSPGRLLGLRLPEMPFDWTDARLISAGDTILMMCHPVSRGLANGSVLEWQG